MQPCIKSLANSKPAFFIIRRDIVQCVSFPCRLFFVLVQCRYQRLEFNHCEKCGNWISNVRCNAGAHPCAACIPGKACQAPPRTAKESKKPAAPRPRCNTRPQYEGAAAWRETLFALYKANHFYCPACNIVAAGAVLFRPERNIRLCRR